MIVLLVLVNKVLIKFLYYFFSPFVKCGVVSIIRRNFISEIKFLVREVRGGWKFVIKTSLITKEDTKTNDFSVVEGTK